MKQKSLLIEILLKVGALQPAQVERLHQEQRQWGGRIAHLVTELGFLREETLVRILSQELRVPVAPLDRLGSISQDVLSILPASTCEHFEILPFAVDARRKRILLAMSDPSDPQIVQEIKKGTGFDIEPFVASALAIRRAIRTNFYGEGTAELPRIRTNRGVGAQTPLPRMNNSYKPPAAGYTTGTYAPPAVATNLQKQRSDWFPKIPPPSHPASLELDAAPAQMPSQMPNIRRSPAPPLSIRSTGERRAIDPKVEELKAELAQVRKEFRIFKEHVQSEVDATQELLNSRFNEQRLLMRGLFDLLVARGYLSKDELMNMLSFVSEKKDR